MRFLFGLLMGFAIGFAGAILFAPQASPLRQEKRGTEGDSTGEAVHRFGRRDGANGFQGTIDSIRRRVNEALDEAKKAADEAERQVRQRFDEMAGTESEKK